jgi:hypothetical protein
MIFFRWIVVTSIAVLVGRSGNQHTHHPYQDTGADEQDRSSLKAKTAAGLQRQARFHKLNGFIANALAAGKGDQRGASLKAQRAPLAHAKRELNATQDAKTRAEKPIRNFLGFAAQWVRCTRTAIATLGSMATEVPPLSTRDISANLAREVQHIVQNTFDQLEFLLADLKALTNEKPQVERPQMQSPSALTMARSEVARQTLVL